MQRSRSASRTTIKRIQGRARRASTPGRSRTRSASCRTFTSKITTRSMANLRPIACRCRTIATSTKAKPMRSCSWSTVISTTRKTRRRAAQRDRTSRSRSWDPSVTSRSIATDRTSGITLASGSSIANCRARLGSAAALRRRTLFSSPGVSVRRQDVVREGARVHLAQRSG